MSWPQRKNASVWPARATSATTAPASPTQGPATTTRTTTAPHSCVYRAVSARPPSTAAPGVSVHCSNASSAWLSRSATSGRSRVTSEARSRANPVNRVRQAASTRRATALDRTSWTGARSCWPRNAADARASHGSAPPSARCCEGEAGADHEHDRRHAPASTCTAVVPTTSGHPAYRVSRRSWAPASRRWRHRRPSPRSVGRAASAPTCAASVTLTVSVTIAPRVLTGPPRLCSGASRGRLSAECGRVASAIRRPVG